MAYKGKYKGAAIDAALDKANTALQEHQDISGKQDVIPDLATIRSNASKGATALQSVPSEYITESELNAKGYLTEHQDISGKQDVIADLATIRSNASKGATALQSVPSEYITETELSTELGKKQNTISDLATIRDGASKGATALQSVPDEYVTEIELTNKGYATTSAMNTALGDKVDKVSGKQLSTEDFTTALKNKLNGLSNYDDTAVNNAINGLQTQINTLVSGDANTAIESFNEIIAFLDGVSDTQTLEGIIAGIEQQIAAKQDIISDLATIRAGAAKGATAIQSHQDISGKLDKTEAASTYLSKTDAASTYLGKTAKAADATKADSATKATQDASGNVITTTYATKTELTNGLAGKVDTVSGKGLSTNDYTTTEKNKLAGIASGAEVNVQSDWSVTDSTSDAFIKNKPSLATVATSGSYNDLSNKPTIPSAVTESTVSGWGFTKNTGTYSKPSGGIPASDLATAVQTSLGKADTALQSYTEKYTGTYSKPSTGIPKTDLASDVQSSLNKADTALQSYTEQYTGTYSKPSGGIPKTDLASAVQTSLGKADTALQSYTEQYTGTITGIKMNGASKGTSGVVDLGTVITSHQDISGKQDKLVSGTNIKTVNGISILGSGDIVIESGGSKEVYIGNTQPTDEGYDIWIDEDEEGDVLIIDDSMSDTSVNPVQNKVIKSYIDNMIGSVSDILDSINGEEI